MAPFVKRSETTGGASIKLWPPPIVLFMLDEIVDADSLNDEEPAVGLICVANAMMGSPSDLAFIPGTQNDVFISFDFDGQTSIQAVTVFGQLGMVVPRAIRLRGKHELDDPHTIFIDKR
ncbi:MAG: hypothetical protein ABI167_03540 [Nitrosospira sp.]